MASLSCGASCMKYILFLFNIIFFITGAAILGVGIWLKVDPNAQNYLKIINLNDGSKLMEAAIWVLIAVGAFIFLVGFLGCCGACRESSCMLCLYAGLLVIVFIMQIGVAVLAIVFKGQLGDEFKNSLAKQVKSIKNDNTNAEAILWNTMQFNLKCCGANDYSDYKNNSNFDTTTPMPQTCCKMANFDAKNPSADDYQECKKEFNSGVPAGNLYSIGCHQALGDWVNKHAGILIGVGIGIGLIQLLGIVFACCVRSEINQGM